jgi:hypothetical protein
MATYSFLDFNATLVGPGGSINIGSGSGVADEGITLTANKDINTMSVSADGFVINSLCADKSRTVTLRLLKLSPTNQMLQAMYDFQTSTSSNHGQNVITLTNAQMQDVVTCRQVAFKRAVPLTYAKDAGMNEWTFDAGVVDVTLGGNV